MTQYSWSDTKQICSGCLQPKLLEELKAGRCPACHTKWNKERRDRREMVEKKEIVKACRQFNDAVALVRKENREPDMPVILEKFLTNIGGADALSDLLFADFQKARGADIPEEQQQHVRPQHAIVQKYYQMVMQMIQTQDDKYSSDITGLTDEDLQATLLGVVMGLVRDDPHFRREVAIEALKEDPNLLDELIGDRVKDVPFEPVQEDKDPKEDNDLNLTESFVDGQEGSSSAE